VPRFVILEHDHPHPHFDFMLEAGDVLWTWRLSRVPHPGEVIDAERLSDHRLAYLDYEGPVGGGRGRVLRRERGELEWIARDEGRLEVRLEGEQWRGLVRLTRAGDGGWRLDRLP
jgi:hypothetical protein